MNPKPFEEGSIVVCIDKRSDQSFNIGDIFVIDKVYSSDGAWYCDIMRQSPKALIVGIYCRRFRPITKLDCQKDIDDVASILAL